MLNYCTHAIDDLSRLAKAVEDKIPLSGGALRQVVKWLTEGAKFVLPDGGGLVELGELDGSFFQNLRLPYPITVLEVPFERIAQQEHTGLITQGPLSEEVSSKRIALLLDAKVFFSCPLFAKDPLGNEHGIVVISVFYQDAQACWALAAAACIVSDKYAQDIVHHSRAGDQEMVAILREHGGLKTNSTVVPLDYVVMQPEVAHVMSLEMGSKNAQIRMGLDVRDEVHLALEFCLMICCSNVRVEKRGASAALNRKRQKSGKTPFFDHHVLQINPGQETAYYLTENASKKAGLGTSPRMHTRRGHIRRLPTGKTTFVRATLVGSGRNGVVDKTYVVRPASSVSNPTGTEPAAPEKPLLE